VNFDCINQWKWTRPSPISLTFCSRRASRETQRAHHLRLGCSILRFSDHADVQLQRDLSKSKPPCCRRSGRWQLGSNRVSPFDSINYGLDVANKVKILCYIYTFSFHSKVCFNLDA